MVLLKIHHESFRALNHRYRNDDNSLIYGVDSTLLEKEITESILAQFSVHNEDELKQLYEEHTDMGTFATSVDTAFVMESVLVTMDTDNSYCMVSDYHKISTKEIPVMERWLDKKLMEQRDIEVPLATHLHVVMAETKPWLMGLRSRYHDQDSVPTKEELEAIVDKEIEETELPKYIIVNVTPMDSGEVPPPSPTQVLVYYLTNPDMSLYDANEQEHKKEMARIIDYWSTHSYVF